VLYASGCSLSGDTSLEVGSTHWKEGVESMSFDLHGEGDLIIKLIYLKD